MKPFVLHPGFLPDVISFIPATPEEYKNGLRNPRGALPMEIRKSFNKATTPAKVYSSSEISTLNSMQEIDEGSDVRVSWR